MERVRPLSAKLAAEPATVTAVVATSKVDTVVLSANFLRDTNPVPLAMGSEKLSTRLVLVLIPVALLAGLTEASAGGVLSEPALMASMEKSSIPNPSSAPVALKSDQRR